MKRPGALFVDGFRAARLRVAGLRFALSIGLGAVGGAVFFALALPLPWMLGAMTLATGAALAGAPLAVPAQVRNAMIAILGVLLGSQFTIDLFARIAEWYVGLSGVVLSTALAAGMAYVVFRRLGGYDRVTSYFASMPGGLSEMMVLGETMGGDGRTISAHPRHAHPGRRLPDRLLLPAGRGGRPAGPAGACRRGGRLDRHRCVDRLCVDRLPGGKWRSGCRRRSWWGRWC